MAALMSLQQLYDQATRLLQNGDTKQAEKLFLQVLQTAPGDLAACQALGMIRFQQNDPAAALAYFNRAIAIQPDFATLTNRGVALEGLGRQEEALESYNQALTLCTDNAVILYNRGRVLQDMSRFEDALDSYQQALRIQPAYAEAFNNLGNVLRSLGRHPEAMAAYGQALALKPDNAETLYNRGNLQWLVHGDYAAALADLEKAAAINPAYDYVLGELSYLRLHGGDWRDFEALRAAITEGVRAGRPVVQPFHFQALSDSPADLQKCAVLFTRRHFPAAASLALPARAAGGKIRLGYVAGEFREHATAHLMAGLFENHDRSRFEIVAFDNGWDDKSAMRGRLKNAFENIIDISTLSNRAAAEKIRDRKIDILVNLNGYVGLHRMGVFAHRPAPVQINYLGSPATSGADYMDYILADRVVIPPGDQDFYTEKVAWLPGSYQVNDAGRVIAATTPSRAECGLPDTGFVFCSFNSSYKLTPPIFQLWAAILKAVSGSVLWLLESNPQFAANLRRAARQLGLTEKRLVFAPMVAPDRHLARLKLADLFVDLLPCGAHTTASDALWAGLPLVTCRGHAFGGRVAASLLEAIGLPELIADDLQSYQALVLRLAHDPALLASLREKLARNRLTTPLFDTNRTCALIEAAFSTMWDIFQRGEQPRGFAVTPDA